MATIKDIGKFKCGHKRVHKKTRIIVCKWCSEQFERPNCWSKKTAFCRSWCARRYYAENYSNDRHPNYKHGMMSNGYKRINKNGRRMMEHRAVMEEKLGRPLSKDEWVHHKNGDNLDNNPDNLMVVKVNHHFSEIECPNCNFNFLIK